MKNNARPLEINGICTIIKLSLASTHTYIHSVCRKKQITH